MNVVMLKGRLAKDPESRTSQNGNEVCRITIAVDKYTKPGEDKKADFISCIAFGKTCSILTNYFKKGNEILIIGSMEVRSWDDAEGKKHYSTDVIISKIEFCGSKTNNSTGNGDATEPTGNDDGFYPLEDDTLPF